MLLGLLLLSSVMFLVGLEAEGWANTFYSGAVQAGTKSWKAFFFGSSDAANLISVDKPPASLWIMELSARVFGMSSWSVLAPQALEGVACVGFVYLTARRVWSPATGLIAGLLTALTPVAVVMFRFNNPDALLVLVLVMAAYASVRALESGRTGWLVLAGALVGLGFTTKMLQAFLVVPGFGLAYLVAGRPALRRRLGQLVGAGVCMFVSSAWWVLVVDLIPASQRPYVGGSGDNRVVGLIFGYNGLGRLDGREAGSLGFDGSQSSGGGSADVWRLFNRQFGGDIAWMIPAAFLALVIGLYLTRGRPRTDLQRATFLVWGAWLLVTGAAFSLGQGIIHPYYSVALAPAVASLVAPGLTMLWARREVRSARLAMAGLVIATVAMADVLISDASGFRIGNQVFLLVVVTLLTAGILRGARLRRVTRIVVTGAAVLMCLGGPTIGCIVAILTPQHTAVPAPGGLVENQGGAASVSGWLLVGVRPSAEVTALMDRDASAYTWVAAAAGSERAASFQLATGHPVIAVGGFNGTDPAPTLSRFEAIVAAHRLHWFVAGPMSASLGNTQAEAIAQWVQRSFPETDVAGNRLFDLTEPLPSSGRTAGP